MISSLFCARYSAPVYCAEPMSVCLAHEQHQPENVLRLPSCVLADRIFTFLTLIEIVRLDDSFNNHKARIYFHEALNGLEVMDLINFSDINWFVKRKCSVRNMAVTSKFPITLSHDVLSILQTVHSIQLFCCARFCPRAMQLLLVSCDHLTLDLQYFEGVLDGNFLESDSPLTVQHINVTSNKRVTEDVLIALVKRCPDLRTLHMKYCGAMSPRTMQTIATHCPLLRELFCGQYPASSGLFDKVFTCCTLLTHLNICDSFNAHALTLLSTHCTTLIHLTLSIWITFDEDELDFIDPTQSYILQQNALIAVFQRNTSITYLDLQSVHVLPPVLYAISEHLSHLTTLKLTYTNALEEAMIAVRHNCALLTELALSTYSIQHSMHTILTLGLIGKLTTLEIGNRIMHDNSVESVAMHNYNLRKLCIRGMDDFHNLYPIQSSTWCTVLTHLPNLIEFTMAEQYNFGMVDEIGSEDCILIALAQHCLALSSVDVSMNRNITDVGLSALSALTHLQCINTSCSNIGDCSIIAIAIGCPELREVYIDSTKVTSVGVYMLAQHCKKLRKVGLYELKRLRDYAVRALIRNNPHLRALSISNNWLLTFGAVSLLPVYCPYMCDLSTSFWVFRLHPSYWKHRHYFKLLALRQKLEWMHLL